MKIAILLLFIGIVPYKQENKGCLEMDVVLLVDVSGSVKGYEYYIHNALNTLVDKVELSEDGINIGAVTFSNQGWVICPLTDNKALLKEKFVNIISNEGGTQMGNGIFVAVNELMNGRRGVQKMLIILSDGAVDNSADVKTMTTMLKTSGVKICSVLIITSTIDKQLMKDISSNCYLESSYENLNKEIEKLDICI